MCQLVGLLPWRGAKEVRPLIDPELCMLATDPRLGSSQSVRAGRGLSFVLNGGVPSACREGFAVMAGTLAVAAGNIGQLTYLRLRPPAGPGVAVIVATGNRQLRGAFGARSDVSKGLVWAADSLAEMSWRCGC
jgi:hypothetical protein